MSDLNVVAISGRLTENVEMKLLNNNSELVRFKLACNRVKNENQQKATADFISCVAWRSCAKYLNKYGAKGDKVEVQGKLQTSSYQKQDGTTAYSTDVVVDRIQIVAKAGNNGANNVNRGQNSQASINISSNDLPF